MATFTLLHDSIPNCPAHALTASGVVVKPFAASGDQEFVGKYTAKAGRKLAGAAAPIGAPLTLNASFDARAGEATASANAKRTGPRRASIFSLSCKARKPFPTPAPY